MRRVCKLTWLLGCGALAALPGCDDGGASDPAPTCPGDPSCPAVAQTAARSWVVSACPGDDRADHGQFALTVALVDEQAAPINPAGLAAAMIDAGPAAFAWLAANARPADGGFSRPVELESATVEHLGRAADRLVILVIDHSASLAGGTEADPTGDPDRASDPDDLRVDFFRGLVASLSADTHLAVVKMAGLFATIDDEAGNPTTEREPILSALSALAENEIGGTPLARGLIDAAGIADSRPDLDPVIVLFTDGAEDGDTSQRPDRPDPSSLEDAIATLTNRAAPIPTHVIQLQPAGASGYPLGRDPLLAELTCLSGGDYHFAASPLDLHAERREALRARLLGGGWRIEVDADLAEPPTGGWILDARSTALGAEPVAGLDAWVWW